MIEHNFKKKFGQNFISDKNLLNAIVEDANVCENDEVLEIGSGAGTLTQMINSYAKKVVSYEIDNDLKEHLLSLNLDKTKFVFQDVMKVPLEEIESEFSSSYKMIANLPYYITTPIIFKFLNGSKKISTLCIMVQKEVAERMCSLQGGKDYGVLSVMINFFGQAKITRIVNRNMFYPAPNVDSAVVVIDIDREKHKDIDGGSFYRFVQTCFSMRRKTLKNNLSKYDKNKIHLEKLSPDILAKRAESFSPDQIVSMYKLLF